MKKILIFLILVTFFSVFAQVIINTNELEYELDGFYSMYDIPSPTGVIGLTGNIGGPYVFNFSEGLETNVLTFNFVEVSDGNHGANFPLADIAERKTDGSDTAWMYLKFEEGIGRTNFGFYDEEGVPESPSVPFIPAITDFPDNITYQTFFSGGTTFEVTMESIEINIEYSFTGFADAYGTIILPGNLGTYDCIQVNYEEEYIYNWLGTPIQTSWLRSYYYLVEEIGIAAIITSLESSALVPNEFNIANTFARCFETSKITIDADNEELQIVDYELQNYPNPFNPRTTISFNFSCEEAENAKICIYNQKGQKIRTLSQKSHPELVEGAVVWNGDDETGNSVASGVYFYKLISGNKTVTKKMIMLK